MRAKRSKLEIFFEILENVSTERLILSHIMNRVGLSYYQARGFLDYLVKFDLINKVKEEREITYGITEKGKALLDRYEPIKKVLVSPFRN